MGILDEIISWFQSDDEPDVRHIGCNIHCVDGSVFEFLADPNVYDNAAAKYADVIAWFTEYVQSPTQDSVFHMEYDNGVVVLKASCILCIELINQ